MRIYTVIFFFLFTQVNAQQGITNFGTLYIENNTGVGMHTKCTNLDTIANDGHVFLMDDWQNDGKARVGTGTFYLQGSSTQNLDGKTEFYKLQMDNLSGVNTSSGHNYIIRSFDIENGNFQSSDSLTVLSSDTLTGWIDDVSNGSVSGKITMQRYIDAGSTQWRFLSSATNGIDLEQYDDDFLTSGMLGSDYPGWIPPLWTEVFYSMLYYDESDAGGSDVGFYNPVDMTYTPTVGQGLWIWCGDTITGTQPFLIDHTEAMNQGDIDLPVSYTNTGSADDDGWSMVGNPYPCPINWDDADWDKTNIDNALYIWNPDIANYASYVAGIGLNGGSANIASSQGFWVKANAPSPLLRVKESCKIGDNTAFLSTTTQQIDKAIIKLRLTNQSSYDEIAFRWNDFSVDGFDHQYDAYKFYNAYELHVPQLSIQDSLKDYAIMSLKDDEISNKVLKSRAPNNSQVTLSVERFENVDVACLTLTDLLTNETFELNDSFAYTFTSTADTLVERFQINYHQSATHTHTNPLCVEDVASIELNTNQSTLRDLHILRGQDTIYSNDLLNTSIVLDSLQGGWYSIKSSLGQCAAKTTENIEIISIQPFTTSIQVDTFTQQFIAQVEGGTPPYQYLWSNGQTQNMIDYNPFAGMLYITDQNQCQDSLAYKITLTNKAEISDIQVFDQFELYPNPASSASELRLSVPGMDHDQVTFTLYNSAGQQVFSSNYFFTPSNASTQLTLPNLASGVYTVIVNTETTTLKQHLIIK